MANATSTQLQELYVAYFGRAADPTGLDYWTEQGITQAAFAANMYAQNEFSSVYGSKTVEAQVNQIYKNLFDREADVTGLTYWTQEINLGNLQVAEIATHLIWAAQNNSGSSADKTALSNRTAAAIDYTAEVKKTTAGILAYQPQSTDPWVSGANITAAVTYLSGIDGTTAHTAAGITSSVATLTANGDPTTTGSTFVLTTNTDSAGTTSAANGTIASDFRFTADNESITADIGTIAAADVLLDGSSADADVMNITANATLGAFTANRIEKFVVDMAAGSPELTMTNVTNINNIEVKGTVAGTVAELNAQSKQPTIKTDGYTRVLTINTEANSGTTTAATAETVNVEVSGSSYGSSASTRSGVTLTADGAGTLETLNITSSGSAANDFALDASTNITLETVNFLGATALTTRIAAADITGLTLTATEATGDQTLMIDHSTRTTTATNANLFTGFDNIVIKDSTTPTTGGDGGSLTGLTSGQKVTFADDLNATTLTFKSVSGSSDTATVVLDNESGSTDTDIASIDIQNVETVTIESSGNAGTSVSNSASATTNLLDSLTGDATTINITGDTALNLDLAIDKASSGSAGSRAVTVDASGSTGAVAIETAASTGTGSVSYTITGTANADIITLANATNAGTITAGAGNDTITSGGGNDTIDLGAGTNTYYASAGTDSITLGAGANTIVFGESDVAAVAQVTTLTYAEMDLGVNTVTVNGNSYVTVFTGNEAVSLAAFVTQNASDIAVDTGVTVTATATTIVLAGASDGTAFDASFAYFDSIVAEGGTGTATTAAVSAISVATTVTGFKTGDTDDVISFDVSEINNVTSVTKISDSDGDVAGGDDVVLINYTAGTAFADTSETAEGQNVIKVAYNNTINAFSDLSTEINASTITLDAAMGNEDVIVTVYYDADGGSMVWGLLEQATGAGAILDSNLTFMELGSTTMTQAAYTALGTDNFSFVA